MTTVQRKPCFADMSFWNDVIEGLDATEKSIPCKYFYDERGSQLFDRICELEAYYPTRTETEIMHVHAEEMGDALGDELMLVEFGSGSSLKTRFLLEQLSTPLVYVPVDISRQHLLKTAKVIQSDFPAVEVLPKVGDFVGEVTLPVPMRSMQRTAVYFPGSTIGNFVPSEATALLQSVADLCGSGGGLLIGIDLQKDKDVLELAYNDPEGVTAAFNLNLLHRMRNELCAALDVNAFEHVAVYDESHSRIEMSLRSTRSQTISLGDHRFRLDEGEHIHTEYSHKYTVDGFVHLAGQVGWDCRQIWTDSKRYFAVLYFELTDGSLAE